MSDALSTVSACFYKQSSQTSVSFGPESMTDQGDHKHYHIADITKENWDSSETFTVEKRLVNKLSTSQGSNKDLKFVAKTYGVTPTITYTDPGAQGDLSVAVVGVDITVTLACNVGGEEISTASEIMAAVNADEDAAALVEAYLATGSTGAGVPAGMVQTALSGEADWATVSSGITIDYDVGQVIFDTALEEYDLVRVTGYKWPVAIVSYAKGYTLDERVAAKDVTPIGTANRRVIAGDYSAEVSVDTFMVLPGHGADLGSILQCEMFIDNGANLSRYYGMALLKGDTIKAAEGEPVEEPLTFEFTEQVTKFTVLDYS